MLCFVKLDDVAGGLAKVKNLIPSVKSVRGRLSHGKECGFDQYLNLDLNPIMIFYWQTGKKILPGVFVFANKIEILLSRENIGIL